MVREEEVFDRSAYPSNNEDCTEERSPYLTEDEYNLVFTQENASMNWSESTDDHGLRVGVGYAKRVSWDDAKVEINEMKGNITRIKEEANFVGVEQHFIVEHCYGLKSDSCCLRESSSGVIGLFYCF